MTRDFEDHCWQDVIPPDELEIYRSFFGREVKGLGPKPALLAIDLYKKVYRGGPGPVVEINKQHRGACGDYAWDAIAPTVELFAAARAAGLPVIYTTGSGSDTVSATNRQRSDESIGDGYDIKEEFAPQPGDLVIRKQRASGFFGTPLTAHLNLMGVESLIMCGESTSGCLRASVVDAFSYGYHVVVAEECCFDRSLLSHKLALFDLHHKYADVMHADEVVAALGAMAGRAAAE
ncbi:MAG: isochorismatase family protein [Alphaproteobacteria bacterium]|nr:isochorismatase family protein [Alphaproteobacteria bacterium]